MASKLIKYVKNLIKPPNSSGKKVIRVLHHSVRTKSPLYKEPNYNNLLVTIGLMGFGAAWLSKESKREPTKQAEVVTEKVVTEKVPENPRKKNNFIAEVSKRCSASVVFIEVKDPRRILPETGQPITASNGSGFVVNQNGYVLTNAHVIMNKPNAITMVVTEDGASYKATIEDIDVRTDLALLKIPCNSLPAMKLGDSDDLAPGEWVVALGSPLSLAHSITAGVISSVERKAEELGLTNKNMKYIQTDASITFGHSGGPLVNLDGEVIGINNLRITAGIAFAIPINYVKEFLKYSSINSPPKKNVDNKTFLGITTLSLNAHLLNHLMYEKNNVAPDIKHGLFVWKVVKKSPADEAGLKTGDIITHVNGKPVRESYDVYAILEKCSKRKQVFSILRNDKKNQIHVEYSRNI